MPEPICNSMDMSANQMGPEGLRSPQINEITMFVKVRNGRSVYGGADSGAEKLL